jgi:predicted RNase H-like HicB family nuclease
MKDLNDYDALPWEVHIERDLRRDGSIYYIARHPEFGAVSGPIGTGSTPEEALAGLREARRSLIGVLLERGDPIPEPRPLNAAVT